MSQGEYGITPENSKFITVGFTPQWYELNTENFQDSKFKLHNLNLELEDDEDKLLAINYDEEHLGRDKIFLVDPKNIKLISSLTDVFDDHLLNENNLESLIRVGKLDQKPDLNNLEEMSIRCQTLKILIEYIRFDGKKTNEVIDGTLKTLLITQLLMMSVEPNRNNIDNMKPEWYEHRIYALKRIASETNCSLSSKLKLNQENKEEEKQVSNADKQEDVISENENQQDDIDKEIKELEQLDEVKVHFALLSDLNIRPKASEEKENENKGNYVYQKVTDIDQENISQIYLQALSGFHNYLCKQTIALIFEHFPIYDFLSSIKESQRSVEDITKYIQTTGIEALKMKHS